MYVCMYVCMLALCTAPLKKLASLDEQMGLPKLHVRRGRVTKNVGVDDLSDVTCGLSEPEWAHVTLANI